MLLQRPISILINIFLWTKHLNVERTLSWGSYCFAFSTDHSVIDEQIKDRYDIDE